MPVTIKKVKGGYRVSTPHGTKAKRTSLRNAKRQRNLLNAVEHGWHPTGNPKPKMKAGRGAHRMHATWEKALYGGRIKRGKR